MLADASSVKRSCWWRWSLGSHMHPVQHPYSSMAETKVLQPGHICVSPTKNITSSCWRTRRLWLWLWLKLLLGHIDREWPHGHAPVLIASEIRSLVVRISVYMEKRDTIRSVGWLRRNTLWTSLNTCNLSLCPQKWTDGPHICYLLSLSKSIK